MSARGAAGLEKALAAHRAALDEFAERVVGLAPGAWTRSPAEGKWSPAEIAEHLRLSLDAVSKELAGGPPMRRAVPRWTQWALRVGLVPRILRGGWFPSRARAPREVRPGSGDADRTEALRRLAEQIAHTEAICRERGPRATVLHPYFGRLSLPVVHRVLAAHARHHAAQLP